MFLIRLEVNSTVIVFANIHCSMYIYLINRLYLQIHEKNIPALLAAFTTRRF